MSPDIVFSVDILFNSMESFTGPVLYSAFCDLLLQINSSIKMFK